MVLTFVLVGLGVFTVVRPIRDFVTAPKAFFELVAIGFGCLGCWWAGESPLWGPVAAGFAHFWWRLEQVVSHIRDWAKVASVTRSMRR